MPHKYLGSFSISGSRLTLNIDDTDYPKKWSIISTVKAVDYPQGFYGIEAKCGLDNGYICSIYQDGEYVVIDDIYSYLD